LKKKIRKLKQNIRYFLLANMSSGNDRLGLNDWWFHQDKPEAQCSIVGHDADFTSEGAKTTSGKTIVGYVMTLISPVKGRRRHQVRQ
jgi:hypothetical protein